MCVRAWVCTLHNSCTGNQKGLFYYEKAQNTPVNTIKACRGGGGITSE